LQSAFFIIFCHYEEEFETIPYDGFAAGICGQLSGIKLRKNF